MAESFFRTASLYWAGSSGRLLNFFAGGAGSSEEGEDLFAGSVSMEHEATDGDLNMEEGVRKKMVENRANGKYRETGRRQWHPRDRKCR